MLTRRGIRIYVMTSLDLFLRSMNVQQWIHFHRPKEPLDIQFHLKEI